MTGESVPLKEHLAALRVADIRFSEERDRRYHEVNVEREKALKIKEEADRRALELAREIQAFRDEKANGLLELVKSERGSYATNKDLEPIKSYVSSQTGRGLGMYALFGVIMTLLTAAIAVAVFLK
jgi:hypothetical protein